MRGNSDRFYIKEGLGEEWLEVRDRRLIRQWLKVMRFGEGDVARLFDGSGYEYSYQFSKFKDQKSIIILDLIDKKFIEEKKRKVYLGFGLLKDRARLEWMMEKCTELGVDGFVPVLTENCQVKDLKRVERLEKKMIEACEQCGRVRVPELMNVSSLDNVLNNDWRIVVLDQDGEFDVEDNTNTVENILLVGPEGGWSKSERDLFEREKADFISLSDNILRAETAAIVGVHNLGRGLSNQDSKS